MIARSLLVVLGLSVVAGAASAQTSLPRAEAPFTGVVGRTLAGWLEHTVPLRFSAYAGLDIGRDNGLPVSPGKVYYLRAPFAFEGSIERVVFDIV